MKNRTFFTILAGLLLSAMVAKVIPWDKAVWSRLCYSTSNLKPGDVVADEAALSDLRKISSDINTNTAYSPEMAYRHLLRLVYLEGHVTNGAVKKRIELIMSDESRLRDTQRGDDSEFRDRFSRLTNSEEFRQASQFSPVSYHYDFGPLLQYEASNYWLTVVLAIPFWLAFRFSRGENPMWDRPWTLLPALAFWPAGLYFLLVKQPVRKIVWLAWACTYAPCYGLALVLSVFSLGVAKAQKAGGKPESDPGKVSAVAPDGTVTDPPQASPPATIQVLAFADSEHTRQTILIFKDGWFSLIHQDQKSLDTGAASSFTGIGSNYRFGSHAAVTAVFGPQYNFLLGKVDATGAFVNANFDWKGLHLILFNRLTFGFKGSKTASVDRHVQNLRGPPECRSTLCKALIGFSAELEERHVVANGRWPERDIGLMVNAGQLLRVPNKLWGQMVKVVNFYGYYDTSRKLWDKRLWLSYTYEFAR